MFYQRHCLSAGFHHRRYTRASHDLPIDDDHDGMSDAWEREHGLDPNQNDAVSFDQDGVNNLTEYQLQSDPAEEVKPILWL